MAKELSIDSRGEHPITLIDSIDKYNKMYGIETLHPLVTIIDHGTNQPSTTE